MEAFGHSVRIPDFWQADAVRALAEGKDVVLHAPTGAGKTYVFERFFTGGFDGNAVYTVPTRALANDKYREWRAQGWNVGIATGDYAFNTDRKSGV
jgi:replicative superfamily II helicase